MSISPTIVLIPFIIAFLVFVIRFYFRESASSIGNPSFLLALGTISTAAIYLCLRITEMLPVFGTALFAVVGMALLATAIVRMFML